VLRCRDLLRGRNTEWERRGLPLLRTRFGLSTGKAVVGNVGAPERLNYTVLGDTVNLASRLEGLNARYGTEILAAESVAKETGGNFLWREVDRVIVKGKANVVRIMEPLATQETATDEDRSLVHDYEAAFALYAAGDFPQAARLFERLLQAVPEDGPARLLLQRCREFLQTPPPDNWRGVTRLLEK
jgi:adenylate cyclase